MKPANLLQKLVSAEMLFILIFTFIQAGGESGAQTYLDSTASVEARVNDLMGRMTLEEKIGQMTQIERTSLASPDDITNYYLGSLLSGGGSSPDPNTPVSWADMYDGYQTKALASRLSIPLIYGVDAVHGHNNVQGAVIFPHNIGLGCTNNPGLIEAAARITALEVAATGIDWTFAPCIAVARDDRWGRTYESFSEDPDLVRILGAAAVKGYQGDTLSARGSVLACAKHYIGDGGTEGGEDQGNMIIDTAGLRAVHLPGYIDAIEQGVGSIMASYSSWNGDKMHGHHYLITTLLKGELGFEGFVVSDWKAIDQLPGDYRSDVRESINAGIDMVMVPHDYQTFTSTLKSLVDSGEVELSRIDDAVRRILRIKFESGLFEQPYTDRSLLAQVGSQPHRDTARMCVRESVVLLKNKDNVLPLPESGVRILVTGTHADNLGYQCGGWSITWQGESGAITEGTTILEGIRSAAPDAEIIYSLDGSYTGEKPDYAVIVVGEKPYAEGAGDNNLLELRAEDYELVKTLKQEGIKVVFVLISGRPLIINPLIVNTDAILAAWLPGTEGAGIADILFGAHQPTGKLSFTWPKSADQHPINYGDTEYDPLFSYGYGITSTEASAPGSSPEVYGCALSNDGLQVIISFNKKMNQPGSVVNNFVLYCSGTEQTAFTSVTLNPVDSTSYILALDSPPDTSGSLTLSYNGSSVTSADGGLLQPFSGVDVFGQMTSAAQYFTLPGKIEAEDYSDMFGVDTEATSDAGGGMNVGWIDSGDWLEYNIGVPNTGNYRMTLRIASESASGDIIITQNTDTVLQKLLPVTGGWQTWQDNTSAILLHDGLSTLRIYAVAGGFNLNWMNFELLLSADDPENIPDDYFINQNYPNPFNPSTTISFGLPETSEVKITVFNSPGEVVDEILNTTLNAGYHKTTYTAASLSSGIYFYLLEAKSAAGNGYFRKAGKMILLK